MQTNFTKLLNSFENEATEHILKFWLENTIDTENGGFIGQILQNGKPVPTAAKASILNTRLLWTFSQAYRIFKKEEYKEAAQRAYTYIIEHFLDTEKGGVYWLLDHKGKPENTKKQVYAQAFAIYSLVEFHLATQNAQALEKAIEIFQLLEKYSFDKEKNGYFEAYNREWVLLEDLRLSDKDQNEKKTMNTHLHVLEAYTNLYRVWKSDDLKKQLRNLIEIFLHKIINKENHFNLFMDEDWTVKSDIISFGHDIEGSWLLLEAAEVLGDADIIHTVEKVAIDLAKATLEQGLDSDGGLLYEATSHGLHITEKHWWPQAESVVGFFNAWQLSKEEKYLKAAVACWEFTQANIVDRKSGEWLWGVTRERTPMQNEDKVGPWKCPYHNGRMCFEMVMRLRKL